MTKIDVSKYVGKKIKEYRKLRKMTQKELGFKIGVKHNTISSYESGTNEVEQDMIFAIANVLDVPINDLFPPIKNDTIPGIQTMDASTKRLPIYGQISCGNGILAFDDPVGYEDVPTDWLNGGEYFLLVAEGDSMNGSRIFHGDKLVIRRQEFVENGEIAAVVVGDKTLLKKVTREGNMLILESSNPSYPTKVFNAILEDNVKIVGKLDRLIVKF